MVLRALLDTAVGCCEVDPSLLLDEQVDASEGEDLFDGEAETSRAPRRTSNSTNVPDVPFYQLIAESNVEVCKTVLYSK